MRNLKRVLSLALACVMLLGMMVVGAGAADKTYADLTDSDQISNKEAVMLLVDLGIIEGTSDGSYKPEVTVDRATMAKLITVMMMGDVDQNSFKGTVTDLTDIDSSWAEGYIKFCYSNKIISGDGKGHFYPTEPVTVVQAAKMLLIATGFMSSDRGYEGDNWSVNVMRDSNSALDDAAKVRPLTRGLSVRANDPLTRDNAAQMIFNTLFVQTKKPNYAYDMGKQYVASYSYTASLATSMFGGLTRHTAVLDGVAKGKVSAIDPSDGKAIGLAANAKDVGNFVAYYKDSTGNAVSSSVVATDVEPIASTTKGGTITNLVTKNQPGYIGVEPDTTDGVSVYYNGTKVSSGNKTAAAVATAITSKTPTGVNGITYDFIDTTGDGKYNTVKITEYTFTEITRVTAAKGENEATITIRGFSGSIGKSAVVGDFDALAAGDYVMAAKIGDLYYVYEPTTITGSVSRYNTSKKTLTIEGTAYTWGELDNKTSLTNGKDFRSNTQSTFYLDENNYVVAVASIAVEKKYAVIDSIAYVPTAGVTGTGYAEARLVFADGTNAVVNVASIGGLKPGTKNEENKTFKLDTDVIKNTAWQNHMYTYTVNSNSEYVLTLVCEDFTTESIVKGTATSSNGKFRANDNTVYVYKDASSNKWYTYKGYRNAPSTSGTVSISYATSGGYASLVYVNGNIVSETTNELIVFLHADTRYEVDNTGSTPVYEYTAAINGEEMTVYSEDPLHYKAFTLYEVIRDEDDYITTADGDADFRDEDIESENGWGKLTATGNANNGALPVKGTVTGNADVNGTATLTWNGSETVWVIGADGTVFSGKIADVTEGTVLWVQTVDVSTAAGKVAIKLAYVKEPDQASVTAAPTALTLAETDAGGSKTLTVSTNKDLTKGDVKLTNAEAGDSITLTMTSDASYKVLTISGAGGSVRIDDPANDKYTLVAGDIGKTLTVTVEVSNEGEALGTYTYSITVA